ncbi:MAG: hypothetical protein RLZZ200_3178 [Pseudomonadota bacterium]|jgi:4-amino-4-deoxychorismate lyase
MTAAVAAWLDGEALAEGWAFDRGLHYGDGLFETMIQPGIGIRFKSLHADRLAEGCRRLAIPLDAPRALDDAERLAGNGPALLKLIVTRGIATARGYSPAGDETPRQLLFRYPLPPDGPTDAPTPVVHLSARLGENPLLAGMKHLNRLELVLARAQMKGGTAFEGLLCSSSGLLACGTMTNVFVVQGGVLRTPRVDRCGIAGVLRAVVLREARHLGIRAEEADLDPDCVLRSDEAFLTNARLGVRPITAVDGQALATGPVTTALRQRIEGLHA